MVGNETFYCIQCGIRVSGLDTRGDRSHCPACLGLPVEPTPRPGRDSSKRIRKPSSGANIAVAVRPRTTDVVRPKPSRSLLIGALSFGGAVLFALTTLTFTREGGTPPTTAVVIVPAGEKTNSSFSQPPEHQVVEKADSPFSRIDPPVPALVELRDKVQRAVVPAPVDPAVDTLADEIEEAASALADEGRFDDALARIRAFPAEYRNTRAWSSLEGLRRQIEARARAK